VQILVLHLLKDPKDLNLFGMILNSGSRLLHPIEKRILIPQLKTMQLLQ
jgi:hypothetical protein